VQTEFFRLSKDDARVDPMLRRFLSQSYEFKSVADYLTGADAVASAEEAATAVTTAKRFLSHFTQLAPLPDSTCDASGQNQTPDSGAIGPKSTQG